MGPRVGQINGYIGPETSQHSSIEKIDSVKAVQARTRWRGFSSIGQSDNQCHLLNVLSHRKPGAAAALVGDILKPVGEQDWCYFRYPFAIRTDFHGLHYGTCQLGVHNGPVRPTNVGATKEFTLVGCLSSERRESEIGSVALRQQLDLRH